MSKLKETIINPIFRDNPIAVLILGICSSLAVTVQLNGACVMALSVTIVTGLSSFVCSIIRNTIPNRVRIIVQLVVVALMVILVDQVLKAYMYPVEKQLSVYIGLIITNCIVMGRIEAFAPATSPSPHCLTVSPTAGIRTHTRDRRLLPRASRKRHPVRNAGSPLPDTSPTAS